MTNDAFWKDDFRGIHFFFSFFFFFVSFFSTDRNQPMLGCLHVKQIASIEASREIADEALITA